MPVTLTALRTAAITAISAACTASALVQMAALRAAGVTGKAPANAGAITQFVSTITDNALWMIGTVAVLGVVVIGALFFFGHSRAADYAAKIALGAVIVVSAPGIAA
jgi:hypothetical protein